MSFVDANGDNVYASGEPFQDLGNPYLDTLYNGTFAPSGLSPNPNQFIAQSPAGTAACNTDASPLALPASLRLDVSVPSQPNTCSGTWGKVYVRRAAETVFSTSAARPVWGSSWPAGSAVPGSTCKSLSLIRPNLSDLTAYDAKGTAQSATYYPFGDAGLYGLGATGVLTFLAADANPTALNPVAAGSTISASGTTGMTVALVGGSPVPSTSAPSVAAIKYSFDSVASGTITVTITSPNGVATTYAQAVSTLTVPSGFHVCP
jgi:hypothetical protein